MANETCLNCGKELTHFDGRRKKVFCSSTCKSINWYSKNKGWAKEYRAKKKKGVGVVKPPIETPINTNAELIEKYTAEMALLGNSSLSNARRIWLEKKIYNLKYNI